MKKLIVLVCVLGSVSSQSLFGMNRALALGTSTRGMRPTAHRVLQQRDYATKNPKKTRENSDGDINVGNIIKENGNTITGDTFYGDNVAGDKVGGNYTKIVHEGDFVGGDNIKRSWFSRVSTGFSPLTFFRSIFSTSPVRNTEKHIFVEKDHIITHDACNDLITKQMNLADGVESIDASGVGELKITQCKQSCQNRAQCTNCQETLTVTAPQNVMGYLRQCYSNKKLELGFKDNTNVRVSGPIKYDVFVKEVKIQEIDVAGAVSVRSDNVITPHLQITMSGSTELKVPITVNTLNADITGSSQVTLSGTATEQNVEAAGSAKYNAEKLNSKNATIDTRGSASVVLGKVDNKLDYDASGASKIHFSGNPKLSGETSGAAKVRKS